MPMPHTLPARSRLAAGTAPSLGVVLGFAILVPAGQHGGHGTTLRRTGRDADRPRGHDGDRH